MAMMAAWAAVWAAVSTGIAMHSAAQGSDGPYPLDMAPDSVDDMYDGCKNEMNSIVQTTYLPNEKNGDSKFKQAWEEAEKHLKGKPNNRSNPLGKEQATAIYAYTNDDPEIYLDFNAAVRTQGSVYKTDFKYHALHFYLTDALQTLNAQKPGAERCVTGYRRTKSYFSEHVLNKEIRFSSFTSSSRDSYPSAKRFGNKSCFEIVTCFGADISRYSKFEEEREVLIPPYEVFKVTNIERRSDQNPCEVVYKLKSTTNTSNLNCFELLQKKPSI